MTYDLTDKNKWELIPLKILQEPTDDARCVCDSSCAVTDNDEIVFYKRGKHYSLQCHRNKQVSEKYIENFPGCHVEFFKVLFVPQSFYEDYYI
jgi:hypothetical protein